MRKKEKETKEAVAEPVPKKVAKAGGIRIECIRLRDDEIWSPPERHYGSDAGSDLTASRHMTIAMMTRAQIPTNMAMAIPEGYFGLILPRSSTFHRRGLIVHPGIIDSGFRDEVMILAYNPHPNKSVYITEGERLAQILILPVPVVQFVSVRKLIAGERDKAGFGSTGGYPGDPGSMAVSER